jgi:hypothetical protein
LAGIARDIRGGTPENRSGADAPGDSGTMMIRHYQPGDEVAQAHIYNTSAGALPGFKPASAAEIARRYAASDPDPAAKFYAERGGAVVGYAVFNPNGRISYPWCLPGAEDARDPLFAAALAGLSARGAAEAWAAYRGDWAMAGDFLRERGFGLKRTVINFVAPLSDLPRDVPPAGRVIRLLERPDLGVLPALAPEVFPGDAAPESLLRFYSDNPYFGPASLLALRRAEDGAYLAAMVAIANASYADPTRIDPAMPCFRLGALGTENERHKRINGMVSVAFRDESDGRMLLAEAVRRFAAAGLTHVAAQAFSDAPRLVAFYDRCFQRQGSFPVYARPLGAEGEGRPPARSV